MGNAAAIHANESGIDGPDADMPTADRQTGGVVTVAHRTAVCSCGWSGRRRLALFLARHDAWMHAATNRCQPGVPLVTAR